MQWMSILIDDFPTFLSYIGFSSKVSFSSLTLLACLQFSFIRKTVTYLSSFPVKAWPPFLLAFNQMATPSDVKHSERQTSDKRKARKRELDRLSQQRKRQKHRERINQLEEKLRCLQQVTDNRIIHDLMMKQERRKELVARHRERAEQIRLLLQTDLDDLEEKSDTARSPVNARTDSSKSPTPKPHLPILETALDMVPEHYQDGFTRRQLLKSEAFDTGTVDIGNLADPNMTSNMTYAEAASMTALESGLLSELQTHYDSSLIFSELGHSLNKEVAALWPTDTNGSPLNSRSDTTSFPGDIQYTRCGTTCVAVNKILKRARGRSAPLAEIRNRRDVDIHIMITAITEGWHEVMTEYQLDTRWDCLRRLDQGLFCAGGEVERLVVLWSLYRMLKVADYRLLATSRTDFDVYSIKMLLETFPQTHWICCQLSYAQGL
jgi:hypothetical protein